MGLERKIHDFLVAKQGSACNVIGISAQQMSNLKAERSGISTKKLKKILEANGVVGEITLNYENYNITIKF
jgi:hypothetical protein